MKQSLNRLGFSLRFSFKNIIKHPFRSFLLLIGFLGLFISLMIGISMRDFFHAYYTGRILDQYGEIDMVMTLSQTSDTRFFRTSAFTRPEVDDIVKDYIPFFEVDVLLETENSDKLYVHVFSSTYENFKEISNASSSFTNLGDDEIIITESFADAYQIQVSDSIILYAGETTRTLFVFDIVEDGKLFSGESIFIEKDVALPFFLESISPSLADLPPSLLVNIHNKVYLDLEDDISHQEAISILKGVPDFSNLDYEVTIDQEAINQFVNRNVSVFLMVISMIVIAILLVMQTTLLVYFEDKKKNFGTIKILGGSHLFSLLVVGIEMLIYLLISFVLSIYLSNLIIGIGLDYLDSPITYSLPTFYILISLSIIFLLSSLVVFYYFRRAQKQTSMTQIKESITKLPKARYLFILTLISFGVYFLMFIIKKSSIPSFIQVLISFLILFILALLLIQVISKVFKTRKHQFVFTFHLKMLLSKSVFYQYIFVLLVSFLSIFLLVLANDYMQIRSSSYQDEYNLDLIVTHVVNDFDESYQEILMLDGVRSADQAGLYMDVYMESYGQSINELVSFDPELIEKYFNLPIKETYIQSLREESRPSILLPTRFQLLYGLDVGDFVDISLDSEQTESFLIVGFFEKYVGNLAFTNLYNIDSYQDVQYNSILVNAKYDKQALQYELWDLYSQKMIVIYDHDEVVDLLVYEMERINNYMTYIISILIFCFILSIFNHSSLLLSQMESNYARLHVLGLSRRKMNFMMIYESMVLFLILALVSTTSYVLIATRLRSFVLFFGEYEPITMTDSSILVGLIFITLLFVISKVFYMIHLNRMKTTDVIRSYV